MLSFERHRERDAVIVRGPVDERRTDDIEGGSWEVTVRRADAVALADDLRRPHPGLHLYYCSGFLHAPDGRVSVYEFGTTWDEEGVALVLQMEHPEAELSRQEVLLLPNPDAALLLLPLLAACAPGSE